VPTLLELEVQPQREPLPRRNPSILSDEFYRAVRDSCLCSLRARGAEHQSDSECKSRGKTAT
jgi:hypothetical protein